MGFVRPTRGWRHNRQSCRAPIGKGQECSPTWIVGQNHDVAEGSQAVGDGRILLQQSCDRMARRVQRPLGHTRRRLDQRLDHGPPRTHLLGEHRARPARRADGQVYSRRARAGRAPEPGPAVHLQLRPNRKCRLQVGCRGLSNQQALQGLYRGKDFRQALQPLAGALAGTCFMA